MFGWDGMENDFYGRIFVIGLHPKQFLKGKNGGNDKSASKLNKGLK